MLERGARQPSLGTLFALSGALGLAPSAVIAIVEKRLARLRKQ